MNKRININDRVQVINSGLNPLTNYYMVEELADEYRCEFDYGIFSGYQEFPKYKVSRHPIQVCQFKLEVHIKGKKDLITNDFDKYFKDFNNWALLYRMSVYCFDEILENIKDSQHYESASNILKKCLTAENPASELDGYITGAVDSLPMEYHCKAVIEYSGKEQAIAVFNSEDIHNNYTTVIFLFSFTFIFLQLELISKNDLLERINKKK